MDFQQHHHGYIRPPPPAQPPPQPQPPSVADPHQQLPPRLPVLPPPPSWFSGQFQYQHHSHQSPSHPHAQQWVPPPPLHSDHHPPHHSYPTSPYPPNPYQNHFPPPHLPLAGSHMPPQYPHSYSQDWSNSWGNNQGWNHPAPNNEEDWASKARAWAASKAETDNQQHFAPVGKPEDQGHFHDQYSQASGPHYSDGHLSSASVSGYQQYPIVSFPQRPVSLHHPQESVPIAHIQHGDHFSFNKDAKFGGDSRSAFHHHQESLSATASLSQQEVSSSYSSVAGKDGDQFENFQKVESNQFPHHATAPFPAVSAQSVPMDQSYYPFGLQPVKHATDLSDQPLDFTHKFNHALDHKQPSYRISNTGSASIHTWPATVYPPVPPVLSGQQHDPSLALVSPLPGPTPLFGTISGPSFQSPIPPVGVPFSIAAASGLDPNTVFPMDAYGVSSMVERPKKASVPNWLRDEIIKNKATIASSAPELSKEEAEYPEDETADKPLAKANQIDNKNFDSSRSEEEDDDEDELEITRSVAINHQIKRVLTEVLLKVTDKLFDEIAMEVLNEDVLSVEVNHDDTSKKAPLSATAVPSPKASSSVLIPAKVKEVTEDDSNKSDSSSPADILGLGTYASDDDDDEEIHTSAKQNSKDINVQQQHANHLSEDKLIFGNAVSLDQTKQNRNLHGDIESSSSNASGAFARELVDNKTCKESSESNAGSRHSTKYNTQVLDYKDHLDDEKILGGADAGNIVTSVDIEHTVGDVEAKKLAIGEYEGKGCKGKEQKNDPCTSETRRNASAKVSIKESDCDQNDELDRGVKSDGKRDENQAKKIRTECRNGSNENIKEQGGKSGEKRKESDSRRKASHSNVKEDRKEKDRSRIKEGDRREHKKGDRRERQRHKHARESNRNKRRRSSSVSSRGRTAKDDSVVSHVHESSNESSDRTDRKLHSRKDRSLSPIRTKRRKDLRSPHSKHSQRRHSPYSSLASMRVRRSRSSSRSRSPVGRKK